MHRYLIIPIIIIALGVCPESWASDYAPAQNIRRVDGENPWLRDLLPKDTYEKRKKNFYRWNTMTPEQREEFRSQRLENKMDGLQEEQKRYYRERATTTKKIKKREYLPDDADYEDADRP